ncbi:NEP1-interacting protein-like 1 [Punica granatum]|uniref:RING-type domain-containing protein n=2 Tax=Punica granatum TaxID=22663 RepID=A0A218XWV1_PUNGR|nr:NEP1-interacting protein-like 1 [Punica granatum]OWM88762.1 hypothetical protein CDL15_Pgr002529 [Punica granatum]PKI55848.1 hypothetical protein CRG98_023729 [Punica granatum]
MRKWLSGALMAAALKFKEASPLWVVVALLTVTAMMKKALFAAFTCILALGGAMVGIIIGALKGQTTETGFVRGAGIGAVTGAITAVQLLELKIDGESLSKVALLSSLMEGKVFMEWVGPAVLKAYQWQVSNIETTYREISDIYDTAEEGRGLSHNCIQRIPSHSFRSSIAVSDGACCCSICLQAFEEGEMTRRLPKCRHFFHMDCLDAWLTRKGSCPICRDDVCDGYKDFADY